MTAVTPGPARKLSLPAFLFDSHEAAVDRLGKALHDHDVVGRFGAALSRLSASASELIEQRLAGIAAGLADVDLGGVLIAGWRQYGVLANAAKRTLEEPGSEELVDLSSHKVTSLHHPEVEVLVDGVVVGTVTFELRVEIVVRALVAKVEAGRLSALESGRCKLDASLSCFGVIVASRELEMSLDLVVDLEGGVPLIPASGHPAGGNALHPIPSP